MATFYTSDQHVGHARICELAGRPFSSVEEMNDAIVERHNAVVSPDDTTYFLGDFAMGPLEESLALVGRMNGRLLLVPGNHDRVFSRFRRNGPRPADFDRYRDAGLDIVGERTRVVIAGTDVLLCHFPYTGDSRDHHDRYADLRPADDGGWLVHGHTHGRWRQNGRQIDVGVDAWNFFPVHEGVLADLIAAGPAYLPPLPVAA